MCQLISGRDSEIKKASTKYIITENFSSNKFNWQKGFGAFSYGHSQIDAVYHYILNQKKHHKMKSFKEEYLDFLDKFKVDYKSEYLFDWLEN
ncbi:hypothetical protein [Lacinutrix salivirga]